MKAALALTGADLAVALGRAAAPLIDAAARRRAETLARTLADDGIAARVQRREDGGYVVAVDGGRVLAREFGAADVPAIAKAVARAKDDASR